MPSRWLVLLALAAPLAAADPRVDPDGMPLPAGCLARLGSTRFHALGGPRGPTFTPAGELLFHEFDDLAVHFRFMDARTGLFVRKVTVHDWQLTGNGAVRHLLGVSDDGRTYTALAVEAGTHRVHLVTWGIAAGKVLARIPLDVRSGLPPFSDNFRYFARYDRDTGIVTVTDARTGVARPAGRVDPESRPELYPAPDGKTVVVGTDTALTVFAVPTGRPIRVLARSKDGRSLSGMSADYSADGGTVVARVTGEAAGVWRCDTRTGRVEDVPIKAEDHYFSGVSPDGTRLIVYRRDLKGALLLTLRTGQGVRIAYVYGRVRFTADGKRFVALGPDGIVIGDADTGKPVTRPADPLPSALQFHDGGRTVAAFSDDTVTLWDTATGREVNRFDRPADWRGLPFAGGRKVFAEVAPGDFVLTDPLTGRRDATNWKFLANARAWRPTACGRDIVAAFSNDGQTRIQKFAVSSGEVVAEIHGLPIRVASGNMAMTPDGNRVVITGNQGPMAGGLPPPLPGGVRDVEHVLVCDLDTGKIVYHRRHRVDFRLPPVVMAGNGNRILVQSAGRMTDEDEFDTGTVPLSVRGILDLKTGTCLGDLPTGGEILATAVSADGRVFACGWGWRGQVDLLEAATGGLRTTFRHKGTMSALAFSPDGTKLAAASNDAPAYLWDVRGTLRHLPKTFDRDTGDALWAALANPDAAKAFDAMQRLAAAPADAVKLFARRQPPAILPAPDWFAARRTNLESREFAVRERATRELAEVAEVARPWLIRERKGTTSPEARARLGKALGAIGSNSPARLRVLRSVEVLEWLRTPAARELLKAWAAGPPRAPLTVAAGQALRR